MTKFSALGAKCTAYWQASLASSWSGVTDRRRASSVRRQEHPDGHLPILRNQGRLLRRQHPQCRDLHAEGVREMVQLAAQAAGAGGFNETALRQTLRAIADGWAQGVSHAMSDGILTNEEEARLRDCRDSLAIGEIPGVSAGSATLDRAVAERITDAARHAALATGDGGATLRELENSLQQADMPEADHHQVLVRAWEEAVEGAIEDGVITLVLSQP